MQTLLWLILALGLAPLAIGIRRLEATPPHMRPLPPLGSVILCAIAFNLTFFWQELWLVIPKALTPGLSPILYHNDHGWTGSAAITELLQGTGAIATLASGLGALWVLATFRRMTASWQVFVFWMAFQGLFQALSQLAVGAVIAGNDVGRAIAFLGATDTMKLVLLIASVVGMSGAGFVLARHFPLAVPQTGKRPTRAHATSLLVTALGSVALSIAFRVPRNAVEVVAVPLLVHVIGIGWMTLGASFASTRRTGGGIVAVALYRPIVALLVLLLIFQAVLRPGIRF